MLKAFWLNLSALLGQTNECMLLRRRRVASLEEVIADLYTYHEQMTQKCAELEARIKKCSQCALLHKQKALMETSPLAKERELSKAKMHLKDRHRLQQHQDRTRRFMHLIRQKIDNITSSQMDNLMVEAMRQYNMTAKRMGLPDKSKEIDTLGKEIQERFDEVNELQGLLSEASNPLQNSNFNEEEEDQELLLELEALMAGDSTPPAATAAISSRSAVPLAEPMEPALDRRDQEGQKEALLA